MTAIFQFSLGLALGVIAMYWFSGRLPTGLEGSGQSGNTLDQARTTSKTGKGMLYPESEQLSREDITGGVFSSTEFQEFLKDPDLPKDLRLDKVTDGVYVAVGYSFVNVVVLEGKDGLIVVDAMEATESARAVLNKIRELTTKPIKAIVLTHHHIDHIGGLSAFIEDESNPPDIWAHHSLPEIAKTNHIFGPRARYGSTHQFGLQLNQDRLWPQLPHVVNAMSSAVPNRLIYDDIHAVEIEGLNVTFIHIPGEADDELAVWLPDKRVLIPADDIYKAFPNGYAIRVTKARDPLVWAKSVRLMRNFDAEYLVLLHGVPIVGRQKIYDVLTAYASAMLFVHDQTVRLLNENRHPDEVARQMRLPTQLRNHPYLREAYGTVEWTTKAVYHKYVGWFNGDPTELFPLTPSERALSLVNWIGVERTLEEAESALESGRTQWALELSSHVHLIYPENFRAKWLRLQALRRRASEFLSPCARNYYLTAALDSYGLLRGMSDRATAALKDVRVAIEIMRYRLKAELTDGVNETLVLNFTDTNTVYRLQIFYSILEVDKIPESDACKLPDGVLKLATTEQTWIDITVGRIQAAAAFTNGQLAVNGNVMDVRKFLSYFQ